MEPKKNPKANLENFRGTFMLIGISLALLVIFSVFSISKANVKIEDLTGNTGAVIEEEQVAVTRNDAPPPPPPPPPQQQVSDVIEIVDNSVDLSDNYDFDLGIDDDDAVDFSDIDFSDDDDGGVVDEPVVWAEQMPEFPGGVAALKQYIAENVEYPQMAQENDIQGTVYLRFVVSKTGNVGTVEVTRGVDPLLDDEAVRVVESLPKFKPGMQGGRAVPVWYSVPIVFQLNN
ncbi:MAG: energy transducer TonB [Bacteroidales bacterium]|nr:energy transducer TonB [Bacteroidales bacterium]